MKESKKAFLACIAILIAALIAVGIAMNFQHFKLQYYFHMLKRGEGTYRDLILKTDDMPVADYALRMLEAGDEYRKPYDDRPMEIIFLKGDNEQINKAGKIYSQRTWAIKNGLKMRVEADDYCCENAKVNVKMILVNVSEDPILIYPFLASYSCESLVDEIIESDALVGGYWHGDNEMKSLPPRQTIQIKSEVWVPPEYKGAVRCQLRISGKFPTLFIGHHLYLSLRGDINASPKKN